MVMSVDDDDDDNNDDDDDNNDQLHFTTLHHQEMLLCLCTTYPQRLLWFTIRERFFNVTRMVDRIITI